MNLLDRITRLDLMYKALWFIVIGGSGVFVIRIVFGILSTFHLSFALLGTVLGIGYLGYIAYRIFFKKVR